MSPCHKVIAFVSVAFATHIAAQDPFTFCKDDTCARCDAVIIPALTAFQSDISAFLDVPQQDASGPCYLIFKSPANAEEQACGKIQKSFQKATCGTITVEDTFMVQFCCGREDCAAAGIIGIARFEDKNSSLEDSDSGSVVQPASSGGARSLRLAVNGTEIKPAYVGPPKTADSGRRKAPSPRADGICDGNW
ncbi:hypothetical protein DHEL01_v211064 [Diaporthe helianthi]|uniref:Uncharacterized protein n=1 Tax=Diaporthe helianthi TaxID=158607 RepID=A0A2P5HJW4_DIAHE|nr:hypothetical protein DHEL01_v211064 [Diaporthe helianthi]